jgi:hypothetical protein
MARGSSEAHPRARGLRFGMNVAQVTSKPCFFCGCHTNDDTKEHLFAKWWRVQFEDVIDKMGVAHIDRVGETPKDFPSIPFNMKIGGFCNVCNNGWMNKMEEKVRPFLLGMARNDLATRLSTFQQLALTNWAIKTVLVFDYFDPNKRVVPDS